MLRLTRLLRISGASRTMTRGGGWERPDVPPTVIV